MLQVPHPKMELPATDFNHQSREWVDFEGSHHFMPETSDTPKKDVRDGGQRRGQGVVTVAICKEEECNQGEAKSTEESYASQKDTILSPVPPAGHASEKSKEVVTVAISKEEERSREEAKTTEGSDASQKDTTVDPLHFAAHASEESTPGDTVTEESDMQQAADSGLVADPTLEVVESEEPSEKKEHEDSRGKEEEDRGGEGDEDSEVTSQNSTDSGVRRMSHMVTPPRQRKNQERDSITQRGNSIILDITSPPDLMMGRAEKESKQVTPSPNRSERSQGFATPPRAQIGAKPRKAPSRTTSIDWFKSTRDKGVADSLTLSGKSQRKLEPVSKEDMDPDFEGEEETVAVFNANTPEGSLTVKALSKRGCNVIAVVRVFTSRNTKLLLRLPRVAVKVADSHDRKALASAIKGADRAIFITKYWERFESCFEETQADIIIDACHDVSVPHIVFSTYEDIRALSFTGKKSQIVPNESGNVEPSFEGMKSAREKAKSHDIMITHMMTSFLDKENTKKSLCLLSSGNGKVIVKPHFKDV